MKRFRFLFILLTVFFITGCFNFGNLPTVVVQSIEIEQTSLEESYEVGLFDISTIQFKVTYTDGKQETVSADSTMISVSDFQKLSTIGTHTISITYKGFSKQFSVVIVDQEITQFRLIYNLGVASGSITISYEEWLNSIKGADGIDGKEVTLQVAAGFIQWKYVGEVVWKNLIEVSSLVGPKGESGKELLLQVEEGFIKWQYDGDTTWNNLISLSELIGAKGTDGKEVDFKIEEGYIKWQYLGDTTWNNLVELSTLIGPKGDQGVAGKEVVFQVEEGYIQWKYDLDEEWTNLIEVASLVGEQGIGISKTEINDLGELVVTYTDDTTSNLGAIVKVYLVNFKDYNGYILDSQLVIHGSSATAPNNPVRLGYTFTGWSTLFSSITSNLEVVAEYSANAYTVSFEANGGTEVESIENIEYGSNIELPIPTKDGYHFLGWFLSNSVLAQPFFENSIVTSNVTLYARWATSAHEVKFVDYDNAVIFAQKVEHGMSANAPSNPSREGYTFIGWDIEFNEVVQNIIVQAVYSPIDYTIEFHSNGGSNVTCLTLPYETTLPPLDIPTLAGHDFLGWYENEELTLVFDNTSMPLNGAKLYAKWDLSTFTISFDVAGGDELDSINVQYLSTITSFPIPIRTDFIFDGWYLGDEIVETPFIYSYIADISVVARWRGLAAGVLFEATDTEVIILGYEGTDTEIVLPNTIGGVPIVRIAEGAFKNNTIITRLILGEHVSTIGNQAFYGMSTLTYIQMPAKATSLGTEILLGSNSLEKMVISSEAAYELRYYFGNNINFVPNSLLQIKYANGSSFIHKTLTQSNLKEISLELANDLVIIPNNQFKDSLYLEKILIPKNVISIGEYAFANATSLSSVTFEEGSSLALIGPYAFQNASSLQGIIIPASVTSIGNNAFQNANSLTTVIFEEESQLTSIETRAFNFATALTSIYIPVSVTNIGEYAFRNASSLTTVTFEEGSQLTIIGNEVFMDTSLTSIHIPASVMIISARAFYLVSSLITVTFEEGSQLTTIGSQAFTSLTSIHIPASVTSIDSYAFYNTPYLIIYAEATTKPSGWDSNWNSFNRSVVWGYVETVDDGTMKYAVSSNNTISIMGLSDNATMDTNLTIPSYINGKEVTQIVNGAFKDEERLLSIHVPNTIFEIQTDTFNNANNLAIVTFEEHSQLEKISNSAFSGARSLTYIYIPISVTSISSDVFYDCTALRIYAAATSKPIGWDNNWNPSNRYVVWGDAGFQFTSNVHEIVIDQEIVLTTNRDLYTQWASMDDSIAFVEREATASYPNLFPGGRLVGISEGVAIVQAILGSHIISIQITVLPIPVPTYIEIMGNDVIQVGESTTLEIDPSTIQPKQASTSVIWSSSDETIATVSTNGIVQGHKGGTAVITAISVQDATVFSVLTITVTSNEYIQILGEASMYLEGTINLTAIVYPDGSDQRVTWETSRATIATVDANGRVTAITIGTVYITAVSVADSTIRSARYRITITEAPAPDPIPDLGGYNIKIMNAESALQDNDPFHPLYSGADTWFKQQAWAQIQNDYNMTMTVVPYPGDAPWGPQRISWINTNAELGNAQSDFYIVSNQWIPQFVNANAALNVAELYARYGKSQMENALRESASYKDGLYAMSTGQPAKVYSDLGIFYNVALMESLGLESPAKMFNEGRWTYSAFVAYTLQAQALLGEGQYAISGRPMLYWMGMVNAAGIRIADTNTLSLNVNNPHAKAAAQSLKSIVEGGAYDTAGIAWDAGVASFYQGNALMQVGNYWFVRADNRWPESMWGDDTRYGYVPFPYPDTMTKEQTRVADSGGSIYMMAAQRQYPAGVTSTGVYRAFNDMILLTLAWQSNSTDYNAEDIRRNAAAAKLDDPHSIDAILYFTENKVIFDPLYTVVHVTISTSITPVIHAIVVNGGDYDQTMDSGSVTTLNELIRIYG